MKPDDRTHSKTIDYDQFSGIYDKVRAGNPEMVYQLLQGLDIDSTMKVLDVGCGTANNTLLFSKVTNADVVGLDLSSGMLTQARSKAPILSFTNACADILPFKDGVLDFVFMTEVVHHLPDVRATMNDIFRVLRPSGAICIVTQSHPQIDMREVTRFFPGSSAIDKKRYPSIPSLEESLHNAGFSEIKSNPYLFAPIRLGPEYLTVIEKRGFSFLHKLSDEEYENGLNELRIAMSGGEPLDYSAGYTFVWAYK